MNLLDCKLAAQHLAKVLDSYLGYFSFGAEALRKMGCILASMPGPKVRMLLMVLLGLTQERDELQQIIDPFISI